MNRKKIEKFVTNLGLVIKNLSYKCFYHAENEDGCLAGEWHLELKNGTFYESDCCFGDEAVDKMLENILYDYEENKK